jgi:excinuclease ABC subunit C
MIRRIFPYCSCKSKPKRPCLFYHLNLCSAPYAGKISVAKYKENINGIRKILKGERKSLVATLRKKMESLARNKKFEKAVSLRDKLLAIESIYQGKPKDHEIISLKEVLGLPRLPLSIEAIDISSLGKDDFAGSVVVFKQGMPDKNNYRRYRIKNADSIDDYAMIGEVVFRRYSRLIKEKKSFPDLIVIDGGKGHVMKAYNILKELRVAIPVIGIAKANEEIWRPWEEKALGLAKDKPCLHLIQRIRDEAHRFAHAYGLIRRRRRIIDKKNKK